METGLEGNKIRDKEDIQGVFAVIKVRGKGNKNNGSRGGKKLNHWLGMKEQGLRRFSSNENKGVTIH